MTNKLVVSSIEMAIIAGSGLTGLLMNVEDSIDYTSIEEILSSIGHQTLTTTVALLVASTIVFFWKRFLRRRLNK